MQTALASTLRERLAQADPAGVGFRRGDVSVHDGYRRQRVEYEGLEGDVIPAFLFMPIDRTPLGGVVVFHQHNGEFHFGKSEVAGDAGDPWQAFGPAPARRERCITPPSGLGQRSWAQARTMSTVPRGTASECRTPGCLSR